MAILLSLLLAFTMVPAAGIQSAFADEPVDRPATTGGDVPLEGPAENTGLPAENEADDPVTATVREDGSLIAGGLIYKSEGNGVVLVGFEDAASLEREVAVPERLTDGAFEYTVKGVDVAEGQTAPNVLSLVLPQTIEDINTKSLAAAMSALARVSVDGRGGYWSSANGMLFRQESIQASSDGSTTRIANRELVWAPPAMVIARVPGTCKTVAPGAFTDDRALETVMVFSIVDGVAKVEKDDTGNVTKEGAFTDEQIAKVNIVTPMETVVSSEGDRVNADAFLAEDASLNEKHTPWCDCGFSVDRFTVGIPYGSTSLAVAVPEDGKVGTPEITVGHYTDHPEWDPKGETGEPENGLVFEYKADMTVSVTWKGDKAAVPSHLELPAYVIENGVKTAVTEVAPNAFEGATQLESVIVPEGITTIGESAFADCANLTDASFPSTLSSVGLATFDGTDVTAPTLPIGISGQKSPLAAGADSSGESGRAAAASGSSESPSMPSALSGTEGEDTSFENDDLTPSNNGSITPYSAMLPNGQLCNTIEISATLNGSVMPISVRTAEVSGSCSTDEFENVTVTTNDKFNSIMYTRQANWASLWANLDYENVAFISLKPPSGYVIVDILDYYTYYPSSGTPAKFGVDVILARDEIVGTSELALASHTHDDRYYTESEMNTKLSAKLDSSAISSYNTNAKLDAKFNTKLDSSVISDYNTNAKIKSALDGKAAASHTHDDRYYTESEVNTKLNGKASSSHTHDDRYYTESEMNTKLSAKLDSSAISSYNTNAKLDTKFNTKLDSSVISDYNTNAKIKSALDGKAAASHTHDDRYYTESEMNTKLAAKANSNHDHDGRYYTETETDTKLGAKLDSSAISSYDTNAKLDAKFGTKLDSSAVSDYDTNAKLNAKFDTKLDKSDFGSIAYAGLDEGDASVYPTAYRAGGVPSIHVPSKDGRSFKGWSWSRVNASDGATAAGDGKNLAEAFSQAGAVTLTAEWEAVVPEANHFFTDEVPLKADGESAYQTSVVKVRLSNMAWDLNKVEFTRNDATGLLRDGAALTLWVGNDPDVTNKGTRLDLTGDAAATQGGWTMPLARLDDDSYGVYVGVQVKTSDVNRDRIVSSLTDGSYVVSLVKMYYLFA